MTTPPNETARLLEGLRQLESYIWRIPQEGVRRAAYAIIDRLLTGTPYHTDPDRRAPLAMNTPPNSTMNDPQITRIIDCAISVSVFSKTHQWPAEGSPEFFEFAERLDRLATAINARYPAFNKNIQRTSDKEGGGT